MADVNAPSKYDESEQSVEDFWNEKEGPLENDGECITWYLFHEYSVPYMNDWCD